MKPMPHRTLTWAAAGLTTAFAFILALYTMSPAPPNALPLASHTRSQTSLNTSTTSGSFTVLSYNIAGLPSFINSNRITGPKSSNSATIGSRLHDFDIVQVQEDWAYHKHLYATNNHSFRTKHSGNIPFGSGLNTLSKFPWSDFRRVSWRRCGFRQGDCFTPKGFTFMRVEIAEGMSVDFYNLHADAGNAERDKVARRDNLLQVAEYIDKHSSGQAVVIAGDTNALYSHSWDNLGIFEERCGMRDVWVEKFYGGVPPVTAAQCRGKEIGMSCEALDKVWYRSGRDVELKANGFEYVAEKFLREDGSMLSDHMPVAVEFEWRSRRL